MRASVEPFDRGGAGENPYAVQADLQQTMQALVGIVRTEAEMLEALQKLDLLRERASRYGVAGHREFNAGWHTCLDLRNLIDVSEAITRSALERRESRGAHWRRDFPSAEAAPHYTVRVRRAAAGPRVWREPVAFSRATPAGSPVPATVEIGD